MNLRLRYSDGMGSDPSLDPKLGAAKRLIDFSLKSAVPALVADVSPGSSDIHNGTATLLRLNNRKFAVTCCHVVSAYRELHQVGRNVTFQLGNIKLDPISQLVAENFESDLAVLELSDSQSAWVMDKKVFCCPATWPPAPLRTQEALAISGYPGDWRERLTHRVLDFSGYSMVCNPSSLSDTKIGCNINRDGWLGNLDLNGHLDAKALGGMSGGPAFVDRRPEPELAGIIYEYGPGFDIMLLRPSRMIQADGSLTCVR
jgi:hypothetical protein